jgi:flagellar biosynthesis protein FlhF
LVQHQTFRGTNVQEALSQVRATLGPNAIIESTRQVTNGQNGLLSRTMVEVTAKPPGEPRRPFVNAARFDPGAMTSPAPAGGATRALPRQHPAPRMEPKKPPVSLGMDASHLERELGLLRSMLEELNAARPPRDRALNMLHAAGIEGRLAKELASGLARGKKKSPESIRAMLLSRIAERLRIEPTLMRRPGKKLIVCVGPTGVGKTTTLAKIAARARLELGQTASVITLDTFRVGAVEQWQRYASLMGLPLQVVEDKDGFHAAARASRSDFLLVDTTGRSNSSGEWILPECISGVENREIHVLLVLPAWLRANDVERIVTQYGAPGPTGLVVTKLDEAGSAGGVLHAALAKNLAVTFLCNGPCVPEDIREATLDAFLEAALPNEP